jgi:ABC-type Fe3+-hydroxamate transport system substrate-binding protein
MRRLLFSLAITTVLAAPCLAGRTLIDEMGRQVVVPDHPHRVICLMPTVTDTVFALGAGDDVVAISDYTKYPAAAMKKPSVGDLIKPSIETILSLHPDLVIGVQPKGPMEVTDQLERVGIPIFLVSPHGIAGILNSIESIGMALNRTPQADELVHSLQQRVDAVRARTKGLPTPKIFMPIWYDPITTIGKNAFITEVIEAAGGRSVTDDLPAEWPQIIQLATIHYQQGVGKRGANPPLPRNCKRREPRHGRAKPLETIPGRQPRFDEA